MNRYKKLSAIILCVAAIAFAVARIYPQFATPPTREWLEPVTLPSEEGFNPIQVVHLFPPIKDAPLIPGGRVKDQVHDEELVLGVEIEGESRAYPIDMLTGPAREIINDSIGELHFAATW